MRSTGRSSPFPSNGGAVPKGSPARRQFGSSDLSAMQRSTQLDGPPGPSSETVLNGLPQIRSTSALGMAGSGGGGGDGGGLRSSSRLGISTSSGTPPPPNSHPLAGPSQLMAAQAAARVAPARIRASPADLLVSPSMTATTNASSSLQQQQPLPPRPLSGVRRSSSAMGGADPTMSRLTPFEEEIFAIGRLNKVLPERGGGADNNANNSRSPSSMGMGGMKQQPIPTLATTSSVGGRISSLEHSRINGGGASSSMSMAAGNTSLRGNGGGASTPLLNPWASASHAGKKGSQKNAALRSVQPSPTFGEHDLTTEIVDTAHLGGGGGGGGAAITKAEQSVLNQYALGGEATYVNMNSSSTAGGGVGGGTFSAVASFLYQEEAPAGEDDSHPNRTATSKPIHVPYAPDIRPQIGGTKSIKNHAPRQPLVLKDYVMIAEACQRASRVRIEGAAYYKIGELLSRNKRDTLHKAIPYFKKYLNISRRLQDVQGEAKALNVLGCTYYSLMHHTKEMGGRTPEELIATALEYHQEHSNIADAAGIFIAQTNMGLCYAALGELEKAAECYKQSMQLAVRSGDRVAEALALANLSSVGAMQGDVATAQVCAERNLEIAATSKDTRVGCEAYEQLGTLSMLKGDYASATEAFLMGLEVALGEGDGEKAAELRCKIGLVQGKMRMQEQMAHAIKKMSSSSK